MRPARRGARAASSPDEIRDQEVQRAWRELSAYFKGKRTEREARAALKIIKAFVRERERTQPSARRPLPGRKAAPPPVKRRTRRRTKPAEKAAEEPAVS
jgi:hypothetical protein